MKFTTVTLPILLAATLAAVPLEAGWRNSSAQPGATAQTSAPLSPEETDTLVFMREEEKMARDVYLTLFDQWGSRVFDNIAGSEQRHMEAMKRKLDDYGIADPVIDDSIGSFENQRLAQMYQELVDQGMESLEDALRAGAFIEEVDILDLERAIEESTHADVTRAYENLMRGSRNHLRAFVRQLENLGVVYEAVVMDQQALDAIVDSPVERGGPRGRGGKGKGCRGAGCRF